MELSFIAFGMCVYSGISGGIVLEANICISEIMTHSTFFIGVRKFYMSKESMSA